MSDPQDSEALARRLERDLDHRVLRRVKTRDVFADPVGDTKIGVPLDTETRVQVSWQNGQVAGAHEPRERHRRSAYATY